MSMKECSGHVLSSASVSSLSIAPFTAFSISRGGVIRHFYKGPLHFDRVWVRIEYMKKFVR